MKSSKLVSWRSPYCRRNSLKRGTPRSRSRMRSSAATSILPSGCRGAAIEVLQELRMIAAASAGRAAGGPSTSAQLASPPLAHRRRSPCRGRCRPPGPSFRIAFGSCVALAELDQVGHQRVQPVDRDELLGEVERRAEVVDAAVDVVGLSSSQVARRSSTRSLVSRCRARRCRGRRRTPSTTALRPSGRSDLPKLVATMLLERASSTRACRVEQAGPVGVHAEVQRLVVEQLRRPLDGVDLRDLGRRPPAARPRRARRRVTSR